MQGTAKPWWRGARGEWYVLAQVVIVATVFLAPRSLPSLPAWPSPVARVATVCGVILMLLGAALLVSGISWLRRSLTPLPYPKAGGELVQTGPYAVVRHPMYSGGIGLCYGWALVVHGWLTLLYAIALHVLACVKADREERWLREQYPEYSEYQRRTPKLVPFLK